MKRIMCVAEGVQRGGMWRKVITSYDTQVLMEIVEC